MKIARKIKLRKMGPGFRRDDAVSKIFAVLMAGFLLSLPSSLSARPLDIGPMPELKFTPPEPSKHTLSNGITVFILEDHELPLISLSLRMRTSVEDEDPKKPGSMGFMGSLWRAGGTKNLKPDELDEALEFLPASVETGAGEESASVSLSCLTPDFPKAFEIFQDVLFHPAFDGKKLDLIKANTLEGLKRKNETPAGVGRRAFRDVLYGGDHYYARNLTEERVKNIKRSDLARLHKKILSPQNAVISVSGDFVETDMIKVLEDAFGSWTADERDLPDYDYALRNPPEGSIFLVNKDFDQSRIYIGALGISRFDPDRFALMVGDYILGGGGPSRLFGEIRSRLGLAYVVGSFFNDPKGPGLIGVGCQTKAPTTVETVEAIHRVINEFISKAPREEEINLGKDSILNSFVFRFDDRGQIVSERASLFFYGYPDDYLKTYPEKVKSVTGREILSVYRKYLTTDKRKTVVVGDAEKFEEPLSKLGSVIEIPIEDVE